MPKLGFRRQTLLFLSLLCGLWVVSMSSGGLTAIAQMPTATDKAAADFDKLCKNVLDRAVDLTQQNCEATGRNQACYGYTRVNSELRTNAANPPNYFDHQGDILGLRYFARIHTESLDPDDGSWGMAVMKLQANLPDTNPGQNVTFILFGDTDLHPDLERTNSFYLSTDLGNLTCRTLPDSSMIVRAPKGMTVEFTLNDVQIKLASIVLFRNDSNQLLVRGLEGHIEVESFGVTQNFSAGQQVSVPMTGENAAGAPSVPQNAPFEPPLDDMAQLAIDIDSAGGEFTGDITLTGRVDAINPTVPSITLGGYLVRVGGVAGWQVLQVGDEVSVFGTFESYYVIARSLTRLRQLSTPTATSTLTPPSTSTLTATATSTVNTPTATSSVTSTATTTATVTVSSTATLTMTASRTSTPVPTDTATYTNTPVPTSTSTLTPQPTETSTPVPTDTPIPSATNTHTNTPTNIPPSATQTYTPTTQPTNTLPPTATDNPTNTPRPTDVPPPAATQTYTSSPQPTNTLPPTATDNPTDTPHPTMTSTLLPSPTELVMPPATSTALPTETVTPIPPTKTPEPTKTRKPTVTATATPRDEEDEDNVHLAALCSSIPALTRNWSITNGNRRWVSVRWDMPGTKLEGALTLPPRSTVYFSTATQPGANVMRLIYRGSVIETEVSVSTPCSIPALSVGETLTATATAIVEQATVAPETVTAETPTLTADAPTSEAPTLEAPTVTVEAATPTPSMPNPPPNSNLPGNNWSSNF